MMEDGEVLGSNEYVLRLVHCTQIRPDGSLSRGAFTPTQHDTDGLSVYRELSQGGVTPEQLKFGARNPSNEYVVVRISVRDLEECFGLRVVTKEDADGLSGHCVIPEFNYASYSDKAQKKNRWTNVQEGLCKLAKRIDFTAFGENQS